VVSIDIPPLRDRLEDMRALAERILERAIAEYEVRARRFSPDALAAMHAYPWPGNVRELENRIKRAVLMAEGRRITAADLELAGEAAEAPPVSLKLARNEAERRVLMGVLTRYRGNISRAAKAIQISRPTFHELMAKHQISADDFKPKREAKN